MQVTDKKINELPEGAPVYSQDDWCGHPYNRYGYVRHIGPLSLIRHASDEKVTDLAGFSQKPVFTFLLAENYKTR